MYINDFPRCKGGIGFCIVLPRLNIERQESFSRPRSRQGRIRWEGNPEKSSQCHCYLHLLHLHIHFLSRASRMRRFPKTRAKIHLQSSPDRYFFPIQIIQLKDERSNKHTHTYIHIHTLTLTLATPFYRRWRTHIISKGGETQVQKAKPSRPS